MANMIDAASAIGEEALLSQLSTKQEEILDLEISLASADKAEKWFDFNRYSEVREENRHLLKRNRDFEEVIIRLQAVQHEVKLSNMELQHHNQILQMDLCQAQMELRRQMELKAEKGKGGPEEVE